MMMNWSEESGMKDHPINLLVHRLSNLTKLRELKLYDNRLVCLAGLQGLCSLHTLDISSNRVTSLEVCVCMHPLCVYTH